MPDYHVKMAFGSHKAGDIITMRKATGDGHAAAGLVAEIKEQPAPKKVEAKVEPKKDTKA